MREQQVSPGKAGTEGTLGELSTPACARALALALAVIGPAPLHAASLPPGVDQNDALFWDEPSASWIARQPGNATNVASSLQPSLTLQYIIALQGAFPARSAVDPFLGEISIFAGNFAPSGWAFCDGQLLAVSQNPALFSLLGTTYGGDGRTTFALPDLRGRVAIHAGSGFGLTPRRIGQKGGAETHFHVMIP